MQPTSGHVEVFLRVRTGLECPTISSFSESPFVLSNRPSRGPRNAAPKKEQIPPSKWTGPQPEKSTYPSLFSQPTSDQAQ